MSSQNIASEAEAGDSCGNSASRRPCRSASDEAAEAVPAESVRLERNAKKLPRFLDSLAVPLPNAVGQLFYSLMGRDRSARLDRLRFTLSFARRQHVEDDVQADGRQAPGNDAVAGQDLDTSRQ